MLTHLPSEVLSPYMQPVLTLMLVRLQSSKTEKFSQQFAYFFGCFCGTQKPGYPELVIQAFDTVQGGLFGQLVENVVAPDLTKLTAKQRFDTAAGLIRLLTDSDIMASTYSAAWPVLMTNILPLLSLIHI